MTPTEIEQMALAAGFAAAVHEGEVIVSGRAEEGPLAVVSPVPGGGADVTPNTRRRPPRLKLTGAGYARPPV